MGCGKSKEQKAIVPSEIIYLIDSLKERLHWETSELDGLKEVLVEVEKETTDFETVCFKILKASKHQIVTPSKEKDENGETYILSAQDVAIYFSRALLCLDCPENLPDFRELYRNMGQSKVKQEKFKCIWHYLSQTTKRTKEEMRGIFFTIREISQDNLDIIIENLWKCVKDISPLTCLNQRIEDSLPEYLQVLSCGKKIGEHFVGDGHEEEDIRIAICPELIGAQLAGITIAENQCLIIKGVERFSFHTGMDRSTFDFKGCYIDKPNHILKRVLTAIDPGNYQHSPMDQFNMTEITRELKKAYMANLVNQWEDERSPEMIATGDWGTSDTFKGDKQLKAIIQLLVASANSRPVSFCSLSDSQFLDDFKKLHSVMSSRRLKVKTLMEILKDFSEEEDKSEGLFKYITNVLLH